MTDIVERLRIRQPLLGTLCDEAADEIERLRAYANHERSLGAQGPMIELISAQQEIERLRAALTHISEHGDMPSDQLAMVALRALEPKG